MPRTSNGFTLIELLVVMFIIGITLNFAVLALRNVDPVAQVESEAKRLKARLELASQEAILQSKELGLLTGEKGYRFLALKKDKWVSAGDEFLKDRTLGEGMRLAVTVEGNAPKEEEEEEGNEKTLAPQVWILYTGEMTPFEITLRSEDSPVYFTLNGTELGDVEIVRHDES